MDELKQYDTAAQRFYATRHINSAPLSSWDVSGHFFDRVCKGSNDISILTQLANTNKWTTPLRLNEALIQKENVILVTDARLKIVHATRNMIHMNGYTVGEVLGKTPKMFQGEATCKDTTRRISHAIQNSSPFEAVVLNYRKDGSQYKCWIKGEPLFNETGELVHFIAYEKEVA